MTKIKIKNTNLELIKLDYYCRGTKEIIGLEKEKLKYQVVYFTNPVKDYKLLGSQRQAYGVSKFTLDANIYTIYDDAWVIQKTKKDPKEKDLEYDRYELATLLGVLHVMIFQHLDTAELICHAIGDGPLLNLFYSSFGNFKQFLDRIKELEENPVPKFSDKNYALQYQRSRYSVYDLLHDLEKEGAEIYVGPDLVTYKRISAGPEKEYKGLYSWSKISSILGNKERANLSIVSYSNISIHVPENKYGIEPGEKELKEYKTHCIIKDGVLWTRQIGVRISKKLHKKLVPTGCISGGLLYKNDYILDLSKIPVISKKWLKVTRFDLAKAEVESKLLDAVIQLKTLKDYIDKYKTPVKTIKTPSDAEKFLHELGIYGGYYNRVGKLPCHKSSETVRVVTTNIALPKNLGSYIIDYINKGHCENDKLNAYFKTLNIATIDTEELKKKKDLVDRKIRDFKFRLILSKYLKFTEHLSPCVPNNYTIDIPGDKEVLVKWQEELKKVELS